MKFNPKDATITLPDGEYDAVIEAAAEETSKKGNPMLHIVLAVWSQQRKAYVHEYFVDSNASMLSMLKQLCAATGIDFNAGEVTADMLKNRNLRVYLKTRTDSYGDKNVVSKYVRDAPTGDAAVPAAATTDGPPPDDDIPF